MSVFILCTQCWQASVCFYLVYPMLAGQCLFLSCVPNVGRSVSVCILCTQCCQASVCFNLVYPMLPGQCLFLSCVPNVGRPVSVCILCTQYCQTLVCLYLMYPMLPGQCLSIVDSLMYVRFVFSNVYLNHDNYPRIICVCPCYDDNSCFALFSFLLIIVCHILASPPISNVHLLNYHCPISNTVLVKI